jgi:hypothetical protein
MVDKEVQEGARREEQQREGNHQVLIFFQVSQFVQNFRLRLWQEHLGIPELTTLYQTYRDATCDQVYQNLFLGVAQKNTEILNKAFPYMPQDSITKVQEGNIGDRREERKEARR